MAGSRGGSARITDALIDGEVAAAGKAHTGRWIADLVSFHQARPRCLTSHPQLLELAGERLPQRYRRALGGSSYGPGICKVDWALAGPVPWEAEACRATATIHLGGTLEEIAAASPMSPPAVTPTPFLHCRAAVRARSSPRTPGKQTFYAYCHVPAGSNQE